MSDIEEVARRMGRLFLGQTSSPAPEVHILLDDDLTLGVWDEHFAGFADSLTAEGLPSAVRLWQLRMPSKGDTSLPEIENTDGECEPISSLEAGPRRIVMFMTHGVSARWSDGTYARILKSLGAANSTAVVSMLPRSSWPFTNLGEPQGVCKASGAFSSTSELTADPNWWSLSEDEVVGRYFLPLLEFSPKGIEPWISSLEGSAVECPAAFLDMEPKFFPDTLSHSTERDRLVERRIGMLRQVSFDAFRLGVLLAELQRPFTLPEVKHVHTFVYESKGGPLAQAQLLLSGLLRPVDDTSNPGLRAHRSFIFHDRACEILRRSLLRREAEAVRSSLEELATETDNDEQTSTYTP